MKTYLTCLLFLPLAAAAGDFVNLTFDQPDLTGSLTPIYPGGPLSGNVAQILKGWTVRLDGIPQSRMYYSPYPLTSVAPVGLIENSPANAATPLGKHTLYLESFPTSIPAPEIRLSQTGTVPANAAGLWVASAGYVQMFINHQKIEDPRIGTFGNVVVDISGYAGQEVNLEFLVRREDSIRFDIFGFTSVPEPSTYALFGVGAALLWWHRRHRSR